MAGPWAAFAWFLEHTCEVQAADRGYDELCARTLADAPEIELLTARGHELVAMVVQRAQHSGQLRADFAEGDSRSCCGARRRSSTPPPCPTRGAATWPSCSPGGVRTPPREALEPNEVAEAMRALGG